MGPVTEYVSKRLAEIDALTAKEPEDSPHIYPLTVAKYELCKLATELKIALKGI